MSAVGAQWGMARGTRMHELPNCELPNCETSKAGTAPGRSGVVRETDVLVLGAGVSGMIAAAALAGQGSSVALLDHYETLGGNHKSRTIGAYTFDIGAFVFGRRDLLFDLFPRALAPCVPVRHAVSRLSPGGSVERYPYDPRSELLGRGPLHAAASLGSLALGRIRHLRPRNAADFARHYLGAKIYRDSGLEHYIERLFGVPAREIELAFAAKRLTWIPRAASIRRRLARRGEPPISPGGIVVRPRSGFHAMYAPVRDALAEAGVAIELGLRSHAIRRRGAGLEVETARGQFRARRLISTIPLQETARLAGIDRDQLALENVDLLSFYYSFDGHRGFDTPIFYNFSREGAWKRVTMHSDYYGRGAGREYFCVEVPLRADPERLERDFRDSVAGHGLFRGDLKLEGADVTTHAYPVYRAGATARAESLMAQLAAMGIEPVGRQGRFDYIPTSHRAAHNAIDRVAG